MLERNCIEMGFKFNFIPPLRFLASEKIFFLPLFDHPSNFRLDDDDFSPLPFHVAINLSRLSAPTRWKRNYTFLNKRQALCLLIADISLVPSGSSSWRGKKWIFCHIIVVSASLSVKLVVDIWNDFCSPATWTMTRREGERAEEVESEP